MRDYAKVLVYCDYSILVVLASRMRFGELLSNASFTKVIAVEQ
jgi:hypothetical protein